MKKSKLIRIVLLSCSPLCLAAAIILFAEGDIASGVCGLALAAVLIFFGLRKKKTPPAMNPESSPLSNSAPVAPPEPARPNIPAATIAPPAPKQPEAPPAATPAVPVLPAVSGYELKYKYSEVNIAGSAHYECDGLSIGKMIDFVPEPDNEHDPKAVAIFYDGIKRGYLPANQLQAMYHDFRARGGDAIGIITRLGSGSLQMLLGFYVKTKKPATEGKTLLQDNKKAKVFRLSGRVSDDMLSSLSIYEKGDGVEYEFDYTKGKYLATIGGDIGYFPKSAEPLLEAGAKAFIDRIDYDSEKDKYTVYVALFPTEG